MAVGLFPPDSLHPIAGIRVASVAAGIRYQAREDLVLFELAPGSQTSAVFTQNAFRAAPVMVAQRHLEHGGARYLLVNSGNANAGTGEIGMQDTLDCCQSVAELGHCDIDEVLPFSTGVIGERLPAERITQAIPYLLAALNADGWLGAGQAIMTTDTVIKGISRKLSLGDRTAHITGIAKGAGMIRPDLATMLAFVATDIRIPAVLLEDLLREAVALSFNAITVDGDTSTNDACVLVSTGQSDAVIEHNRGGDYEQFFKAILDVMTYLAQAIVRDGEGATKFVTITVQGALSQQEARSVAYTLAHSPLVKTAWYAGDPNWGRLVAALGRAGIDQLNINDVELKLNDVMVFQRGARAASYQETQAKAVMAEPEFSVRIDLHRGDQEACIWTTDLSHDYVRINADYRS